MASEIQGANTMTLLAGGDLTQYTFVVAATGASAPTASTAGSGVPAVGVVQNAPTTGKAATIWLDGQSKVVAGGAIQAGQYVIPDANGKAIKTPAAGHAGISGLALSTTTAEDQMVSVRLLKL